MCGIVGCAGDLTGLDYDFFNNILIMDIVRGPHATGVVMVPEKDGDEGFGIKQGGLPFDLLNSKEYTEQVKLGKRVMLGHNRWATRGKMIDEHAHPFRHGGIYGVHNGTLNTMWTLPDHNKFEVDSDNLIYSIYKEGIEETWENLNGSAALVWWDSDNATLNFARNLQRPLHYTHSLDFSTIYWASEKEMLACCLVRNGIKYTGIKSFNENVHYELEVVPGKKRLPPFKTKKLTPYVSSWSHYNDLSPYALEKIIFVPTEIGRRKTGEFLMGRTVVGNRLAAVSVEVSGNSYKDMCNRLGVKSLIGCTVEGDKIWESWEEEVGEITKILKPSSISLCKENEEELEFLTDDDRIFKDQWEDDEDFYSPVSMADFYNRYTTCSSCRCLLDPDEDNYYYGMKEALCPLCFITHDRKETLPKIRIEM